MMANIAIRMENKAIFIWRRFLDESTLKTRKLENKPERPRYAITRGKAMFVAEKNGKEISPSDLREHRFEIVARN